MPTETEILILDQLAEMRRRLDEIEARLAGRMVPVQIAPKGSFPDRMETALRNHEQKKQRKQQKAK